VSTQGQGGDAARATKLKPTIDACIAEPAFKSLGEHDASLPRSGAAEVTARRRGPRA